MDAGQRQGSGNPARASSGKVPKLRESLGSPAACFATPRILLVDASCMCSARTCTTSVGLCLAVVFDACG